MDARIKDLTGQTFGYLTVIELSDKKGNNPGAFWKCLCKCGNIKDISSKSLYSGTISCGCGIAITKKMEDLTGRKINEWTVVEFDRHEGNYYWFCRCSCGVVKSVSRNSLMNGSSKSCGHGEDFVGKRFGRLVVVKPSETKLYKRRWVCKCDCGNEIITYSRSLITGRTTSCGCFQIENSSIVASRTMPNNKNRYKHKWFFYRDGDVVFCDSSYEVIFWNYARRNGIEIEYCPETFKLMEGMRYTPDFYLPNEDMWVETKGSFAAYPGGTRQKLKTEIFSEDHNLKIYFWNDLIKICKMKYRTMDPYISRAKKLGISIEEYFAKDMYPGV